MKPAPPVIRTWSVINALACARAEAARPVAKATLVDLGVVEPTLAIAPCKPEVLAFAKGWFRRPPRPTGNEEIS